jgi:hypothetical protein
MPSNKILTFSKSLNPTFRKYVENTTNLCLYKLGSYNIPNNIMFPLAKSLTLINCNKYGISNIFNPNIFPNLKSVNYLSVDPCDFKIYERYNRELTWIFPNKTYDFYDFMVKSGRGIKDSELIKKYIKNMKITNNNTEYDISFECDLNIPDYGIVIGEWWQLQFYEYIKQKYYINEYSNCLYPGEKLNLEFNQEIEEDNLRKEFIYDKLNRIYSEDILLIK